MTSIFIMDNDTKFSEKIIFELRKNRNFYIVGSATNGIDGLEFIKNYKGKIDVLVLDLLLPIMDGIIVLNEIKAKYKYKVKKIIITSLIFSNDVIQLINKAKISYILVKPYSHEMISESITLIASTINDNSYINNDAEYDEIMIIEEREKENKDAFINNEHKELLISVEREASILLKRIGIPCHIKGFQYLKKAIIEIFFNNNYINQITKSLYPLIADFFSTTSSSVEKGIRRAIDLMIARGNYGVLENIFGMSIYEEDGKPTNSQLIMILGEHLKLKLGITDFSIKV